MTLMGEIRAQPPLSPSHWMLHGDGMVRLPFTKTVVRFPSIPSVLHKMRNNRRRFVNEEQTFGETRQLDFGMLPVLYFFFQCLPSHS